jgi:hypothetical protein
MMQPRNTVAGRAGDSRRRRRLVGRFAVAVLAGWIALVAGTAGAKAQSFASFVAGAPMSFGVVATGMSSSGSVTLDAATGAVTTSGGITFFGGTTAPATFSGQGAGGTAGCIVTLTFPASLTLTGAGGTATLSNFTLSPASVTLSGQRRFSFKVGGRLTVPAGLSAGSYSGTITATAIFTNC